MGNELPFLLHRANQISTFLQILLYIYTVYRYSPNVYVRKVAGIVYDRTAGSSVAGNIKKEVEIAVKKTWIVIYLDGLVSSSCDCWPLVRVGKVRARCNCRGS